MDLSLPDRLHPTRDLLMHSLPLHPSEKAPAMPAGLAADLMARFAPQVEVVTVVAPASWFEKVRSFLATPGFGAVAAAVVVLGVAIPMVSSPGQTTTETFRGGPSTVVTGSAVRIVFVGENAAVQDAVEESGSFEASALGSVATLEMANAVTGPKVIVNFATRTIIAYSASGTSIHSVMIPENADEVSGVIAAAVSML